MSTKQQTASGVFWTSISTFTIAVIQFFQLALLARLLEPNDFGLMAMLMVVIGFANAFADMGISNAIIHHQSVSRTQLSSLYWLNILAGIVVCLLVIALSPIIAQFYHEPRLTRLMLWAALIFLITPFGQQFQVLFQKNLKFQLLAVSDVISAIIGFVVSVLAALHGQGVLALIWGQLTTAACRSGLLMFLGWSTWRPSLYLNLRDLGGFVSFGLYQMAERSINYFAWNMDKLLIGRLLGATSLGVYNVAYQLMVRPFMVLNPILTRVAFPVFASIQNDNRRLSRGYIKLSQIIAFANCPIYFCMFALAQPLILLLLGSQWQPAIPVFQILVWLGALYSLGNPLGSLLLAKGRADLGFWINLSGLIVYAIAILVGSQWGIMGVTWALLLSNALILIPIDFWIRWVLVKMRPDDYMIRIAPFVLLSTVLMLGMMTIYPVLPGVLWLKLVFSVVFGGMFYLGSTWLFQRQFVLELISVARTKD
ncbi:MAG: MOP flippase family protein [Thermosynechococcaceae cyanobacterium MS004]|nr:MOP flippase family protein [Thermosynechococcaceae cyanobacterium MS004]